MTTSPKNYMEPTRDEIATYAYYLWESEGRPLGRDVDYWLQAEAQIKAHRQFEARLGRAKKGRKSAPKAAETTVEQQVGSAEPPAKAPVRRPSVSRRPNFARPSEVFA